MLGLGGDMSCSVSGGSMCVFLSRVSPSGSNVHVQEPWPYLAPPISFLMTYILAAVLCMAVTAMGGWHLWMVACGETSVESQDNEQYRRFAGRRGEVRGAISCSNAGFMWTRATDIREQLRLGVRKESQAVLQHRRGWIVSHLLYLHAGF